MFLFIFLFSISCSVSVRIRTWDASQSLWNDPLYSIPIKFHPISTNICNFRLIFNYVFFCLFFLIFWIVFDHFWSYIDLTSNFFIGASVQGRRPGGSAGGGRSHRWKNWKIWYPLEHIRFARLARGFGAKSVPSDPPQHAPGARMTVVSINSLKLQHNNKTAQIGLKMDPQWTDIIKTRTYNLGRTSVDKA